MITTKLLELNKSEVKVLDTFPHLDLTQIPTMRFKYLSEAQAMRALEPYPEISAILTNTLKRAETAPFKHRWIDIKVQSLKKGQNPANGLWHLDSCLNAENEYQNYLILFGDIAPTQFIKTPLSMIPATSGGDFNRKVLLTKHVEQEIPSETLIQYDGTNIHRSTAAKKDGKRLLLRVICTDRVFRSQNFGK